MRSQSSIALALAASLTITMAADKKKKKKDEEPPTQTLPLLQEPPLAVAAEPGRFVFRTSPLSAKGLLSQQVRDGLKALIRDNRGANIVKLRAFVAGTGDVRRVQTIVSEMFSDKRATLPALSTIQAGALPMEGAQVVIESIGVEKKVVNRNGVAFISGQPGPTIDASIEKILAIALGLGDTGEHVLKVTCLFSSLDNHAEARAHLQTAFPNAALNLVQMQRLPVRPPFECEAVAALQRPAEQPVRFVKPEGDGASSDYSQIALIASPRVVISGLQLGFGSQDADVRLAFDRLRKAMESQRADLKDVVVTQVYPMSDEIAARVRKLQFELWDRARPPATTVLPMEGLPSLDASFGIEVIAAVR
jgi:enamine deaminase RidA (YjgF/YER057c/UK114 family)